MKIAGLDLSINGSGLTKVELNDELNVVNVEYMSFYKCKEEFM